MIRNLLSLALASSTLAASSALEDSLGELLDDLTMGQQVANLDLMSAAPEDLGSSVGTFMRTMTSRLNNANNQLAGYMMLVPSGQLDDVFDVSSLLPYVDTVVNGGMLLVQDISANRNLTSIVVDLGPELTSALDTLTRSARYTHLGPTFPSVDNLITAINGLTH